MPTAPVIAPYPRSHLGRAPPGHLLVALEGDQSAGWDRPLVLRYAEDLTLADVAGKRPCGMCGLVADCWRGPDPCLGLINGVAAACCGHGDTNEAYVVLRNDKAYYGERALAMLAKLHQQLGCQLRLPL